MFSRPESQPLSLSKERSTSMSQLVVKTQISKELESLSMIQTKLKSKEFKV
jgi:hypothetical protein